MKKIFKTIVVALCLVMSFSLTACGAKFNTLEDIQKKGKLIVATSPDFPPFEFKDGSKTVGWDMDVAAEFAKDLGVKLQIDEPGFDGVLAAIPANKADIGMAGISYSEERAKTFTFTDTVFDSKQVLIVKKGSTIATLADLAGKKVGAQVATVGFSIASCDKDWAYSNGELIIGKPKEVKAYDNGSLAVQDLINGRIDAVIIDILPAQEFVSKNAADVNIVMSEGSELVVKEDKYAFIVGKGNKTLCDKLNELIAKYKAKGGLFEKLNEKYGI